MMPIRNSPNVGIADLFQVHCRIAADVFAQLSLASLLRFLAWRPPSGLAPVATVSDAAL